MNASEASLDQRLVAAHQALREGGAVQFDLTGVTPHQFVLRARLRAAALRLLDGDDKVIEIALGAGFGDVSNFNAAFRREFGVSPRAYRLTPPAPNLARTFATTSPTHPGRR